MASDSRHPSIPAGALLPTTRLGYAVGVTALAAAGLLAAFSLGVVSVPSGTTDLARDLLERYGLVALFGVFVLEGAMLLYFAPSETLVPAAILVFGEAGADLAAILTVAVAGATVGQVVLFLVAKRGGREYLLERAWFRIGEDRLRRFDAWFERWGPLAIPASNTMLFTRGMLTIPAGFAEMDTRKFAVLSAIGTVSFEGILAALTLGVLQVL